MPPILLVNLPSHFWPFCWPGGHRKALETFPEFSDFEALGVPLAASEKALATLSQAGMSARGKGPIEGTLRGLV